MKASLVFDGEQVNIPESMGMPLDDQCQGTQYDVLGEIASRVCYDSLGRDDQGKRKGRSSIALHEHIHEVQNYSVYEHINYTVVFEEVDIDQVIRACVNRKGIWLNIPNPHKKPDLIEVTVNARAILEWDRHHTLTNNIPTAAIYNALHYYGHNLAPFVIPPSNFHYDEQTYLKHNDDLLEDQAWITMYLYGSRGFTHEQVRHRYSMSQRSTRYVDESESEYIMHPLIRMFLDDRHADVMSQGNVSFKIAESIAADRRTYDTTVSALQSYLISKGLDKITARKQARGAARGYLGNALASEMLFSAPVSGWRWIISQRASRLADAEIRTIYCQVLNELKRSRYGYYFDDYDLVDSPDGMGQILSNP